MSNFLAFFVWSVNISWKGIEKDTAGKCDISSSHSSRCMDANRPQLSVVVSGFLVCFVLILHHHSFTHLFCSVQVFTHNCQRLFVWTVEAQKLDFCWVCASWMNFQVCNETFTKFWNQKRRTTRPAFGWFQPQLSLPCPLVFEKHNCHCKSKGSCLCYHLDLQKD